MTEPTRYICDLCGHSSYIEQEILDHMSAVHGETKPVMVGQIRQDQGQMTMVQADGRTITSDLDLADLTRMVDQIGVQLTTVPYETTL